MPWVSQYRGAGAPEGRHFRAPWEWMPVGLEGWGGDDQDGALQKVFSEREKLGAGSWAKALAHLSGMD